MNDITTVAAERQDLELHVDLCAQRYLLLEKRLAVVETKVDGLAGIIQKSQNNLSKVIITSATTIVASLLGLILALTIKF